MPLCLFCHNAAHMYNSVHVHLYFVELLLRLLFEWRINAETRYNITLNATVVMLTKDILGIGYVNKIYSCNGFTKDISRNELY